MLFVPFETSLLSQASRFSKVILLDLFVFQTDYAQSKKILFVYRYSKCQFHYPTHSRRVSHMRYHLLILYSKLSTLMSTNDSENEKIHTFPNA